MNKLLLLPFFLLFFISVDAQISMLDGNPRWFYQNYDGAHQPLNDYKQLALGADTVINQITYKKCDDGFTQAALREDAGIVYIWISGASQEKKLFDFNLNVGNIIDTSTFYFSSTPSDTVKVQNIDSVYTQAGFRKIFTLNHPAPRIIEGVGMHLYSFFTPNYWPPMSGGYELICFEQFGVSQTIFGLSSPASCANMSLEKVEANHLEIFPNPVSDILHINGKPNVSITLVSVYGTKLANFKIQTDGTCSISLNSYASGIYFLVLDNGTSHKIQKP